jgi:hypothetical protein
MSIGTLDWERVDFESGYHWQDVDQVDQVDQDEQVPSQASWGPQESPSELATDEGLGLGLDADWNYGNPVDELLTVLVNLGRGAEAEVIRRVLVDDTQEEDMLIRSLVSAKWAEDWDSPEDSVYDES